MPFKLASGEKHKNYYVQARCTEEQERVYKACAEAEGVSLGSWMRATLDYAAQTWYVPELSSIDLSPTGRMIKRK